MLCRSPLARHRQELDVALFRRHGQSHCQNEDYQCRAAGDDQRVHAQRRADEHLERETRAHAERHEGVDDETPGHDEVAMAAAIGVHDSQTQHHVAEIEEVETREHRDVGNHETDGARLRALLRACDLHDDEQYDAEHEENQRETIHPVHIRMCAKTLRSEEDDETRHRDTHEKQRVEGYEKGNAIREEAALQDAESQRKERGRGTAPDEVAGHRVGLSPFSSDARLLLLRLRLGRSRRCGIGGCLDCAHIVLAFERKKRHRAEQGQTGGHDEICRGDEALHEHGDKRAGDDVGAQDAVALSFHEHGEHEQPHGHEQGLAGAQDGRRDKIDALPPAEGRSRDKCGGRTDDASRNGQRR